jgi:hypothetical protein
LPIHIAAATVYWTSSNSLVKVLLNGIQIWAGSQPFSGQPVPGGPFTLNNGLNSMQLYFTSPATSPRVVVSFAEFSCSFVLYSSP